MNDTIFITFGCSWTAGIGCCYEKNQSISEFRKLKQDNIINDNLSFRGILSKKYNLRNINFSEGGSSNQRQFRLAEEFFGSYLFDNISTKNIIVLWGLTSTARNEFYFVKEKEYQNIFYTEGSALSKMMISHYYDHNVEVMQLSKKIKFWDKFFKSNKIQNIWFDTFNHHNYEKESLINFVNKDSSKRDFLSHLNTVNNNQQFDDNYHYSDWTRDSNRIDFLVNKNILNPYTFHPTVEGHTQIAKVLEPFIEEKIKLFENNLNQ